VGIILNKVLPERLGGPAANEVVDRQTVLTTGD